MNKHNLELLHFSASSDSADDPLRKGSHQVVYTYLKKEMENEEVDDLEIAAIDKENNSSLDPMPVDKWIDWWEYFVLPALLENDFNDDLMIAYPDAGTDLTEL